MITRRIVWALGVSQLICWGISYYLIGVFGKLMAADLGWSQPLVYGGFSAALVVMGISSPVVGRTIDRWGGRPVMVAGSVATIAGCLGLGVAHDVATYYASWLCLGLAMRMTLYDAAFASLARLGGMAAKRPISQITLLGGLASTAFWPIGALLAEHFGWRGAVIAYAGFAALTVPLHLAIPSGRAAAVETAKPAQGPIQEPERPNRLLAGCLYGAMIMLLSFLNSGLSAHVIPMLIGIGVATATAVWVASLRGIAQSCARLIEIVFGARVQPLDLSAFASSLLPLSYVCAMFGGQFIAAAVTFSLLYGAGNGLLTIARGTLPLVLFDQRTYGAFVGGLLVPSFFMAAVAPVIYAFVIEQWGNMAALQMSVAVAVAVLGAALILRVRFRAPATLAATARVPS